MYQHVVQIVKTSLSEGKGPEFKDHCFPPALTNSLKAEDPIPFPGAL